MKFPLTYYVIFAYKDKEDTHEFKTTRPITREMIDQEIEHFVSSKHGRSYDPSKIFVKSYRYEESE